MKFPDHSERIPKSMVPIGYRPLLWHIMKYYAHFGHTDFILCLGYKDHIIKDYFLNYHEYVSSDFVLKGGIRSTLSKDIDDWKITFVDTGVNSNSAQRLQAVKKYLLGEEMFLLNYSDRLTDLDLAAMTSSFDKNKMIGMMMAAKPTRSFHVTSINEDNLITEIENLNKKMEHLWVNGGHFILTPEIFNHIDTSGNLMEKTFPHLVADGRLGAYPHKGVTFAIDSYEEKHALDEMCQNGNTPWQVWDKNEPNISDNKSQKFPGTRTALDCLLKIALLNEELFLFANI